MLQSISLFDNSKQIHPMKLKLQHLFVINLVALFMPIAHSATIVWDPAKEITSDTDVYNSGEFVYAYKFGNYLTPTDAVRVNNVLFTTLISNPGNSITIQEFKSSVSNPNVIVKTSDTTGHRFSGAFLGTPSVDSKASQLSTAYSSLLNSIIYDLGGSGYSITLNNLNPGTEYILQIWSNSWNGVSTTTTINGAITLDVNTNPGNTAGGVGQFTIGKFTASTSTEVLTFSQAGYINALSLHAVPEPTSLPVLGIAALGFFLTSRHRSRKPKHIE
jgi:hypothetical protein